MAGGAAATTAWVAAPSADRYDVARGELASLAAGDYGACFADDVPASSVADGSIPAPGGGFTYLVRGEDAGCGGAGTYGGDSSGRERPVTACP